MSDNSTPECPLVLADHPSVSEISFVPDLECPVLELPMNDAPQPIDDAPLPSIEEVPLHLGDHPEETPPVSNTIVGSTCVPTMLATAGKFFCSPEVVNFLGSDNFLTYALVQKINKSSYAFLRLPSTNECVQIGIQKPVNNLPLVKLSPRLMACDFSELDKPKLKGDIDCYFFIGLDGSIVKFSTIDCVDRTGKLFRKYRTHLVTKSCIPVD
jgi:hypothetical protein